MLEADMSSSVRVFSSRLGTALSIATIEPLQSPCVLIHCPNTVVWAGMIAAATFHVTCRGNSADNCSLPQEILKDCKSNGRKRCSPDLVLAMLRDAHHGALRLKGDKAEPPVLRAVDLVSWQVNVHDVPKILEVILSAHSVSSGTRSPDNKPADWQDT